MNKCDTCFYNGNAEYNACHECNNEKDMYRARQISRHEKLRSLSLEDFAKYALEMKMEAFRSTVNAIGEVFGHDWSEEIIMQVENTYNELMQAEIEWLQGKVDR